MRRVFVLLSALVLGCFSYGEYCESEPCPPPPAAETCAGRCAPFIGGGWEPVLVSASTSRTRAPCPSSAPFEAMSSASAVTACGVQADEGECPSGWICLPEEPAWSACIVRDGAHACPEPYPDAVDVPDEPITLCCPDEQNPPA
jgi:hypothetical protein